MKKTALVFTHEEVEGPGLFGDVLEERGFDVKIIYTPASDVKKLDDSVDLLLVMGGPMGVYESDKYLFLNDEIGFLQRRLATGKPVLGVCLGSQLMAKALGSEVYKGKPGQEIGWFDIKLNDNAKNNPVLSHLDGMMFHWHGDTFDLPKNSTLLGSSEKYQNQIFSYGKNALALQCHPEVKADQLEDWYPSLDEKSAAKIKADTAEYIAQLNNKARMFFESWLESIDL